MSKINITFPDGNKKEFEKGISPIDIAKSISDNLARQTFAADVNGKIINGWEEINEDAEIVLHTFRTEKGKEIYWHSSAHILAQAVVNLWPDTKVAIGPAIDEGFYYDFDRKDPFTEEDLKNIESEMKKIAKKRLRFSKKVISRNEALKYFEEKGEIYKVDLINGIDENETLTLYEQGDFVDLCRGPHIPHTGVLKAVKLLKTSGAYWRGDEKNKMLQRIYGISFPSKNQLKEYLHILEEAKKRDHRKLGKELDLFSISDNIGPGLVLWHPNGATIRNEIEGFWKKEHFHAGYKLINTPHIGKANLWETSGHLGFYNESMYAPMNIDDQEYYIKPMNCPFHIEIYNNSKKSYKELPVRYAEMGTVYRYERSGTLHGLMRVRGFTQDDAHIICTSEQLEKEVEDVIDFSFMMLKSFGFTEFEVYLSTQPDKFVGEKENWDKATESLKKALEKNEIRYEIDEGGGAFYGPKIDIKIKDALNRMWQCSTIQFDFNLPDRFDMSYVGSDNNDHRPFMIHRALLGSLERFFGIMIEHYAGDFPLWLSPVQVQVIPVSDNYERFANRIHQKLRKEGIRAEIDMRNEKVGYKIRDAEIRKVPYMFIIGEREEESNSVSIRKHKEGDLGSFEYREALKKLNTEISEKE